MANTLRHAIAAAKPLAVPSVHDGISALLVRELGFQAAYVGSYATGATNGAAATHIEDHVFGKHLKADPDLETVRQTVDKIKAAVDARSDADFMVIGRTDASKRGAASADGPAQAVERMLAYQEAGADGVFIAGRLDEQHWSVLKAEAEVPVFTVDFPGHSAAEVGAWGADVVLYRALGPFAAARAMRTAFETRAREGSTTSIEPELGTLAEFDRFLGIEQAREDARAYGLLD
ncbi:isocitrate lyase/phosphoenolpyruvate mutase family protein [Amycolatopsis sp. NPDC001319]|uniref:isocitrate lyase/phosphoenolpyruvate mutase family protein n=1 Tax=unclassified Amycolatopsis TaxID=2618356 RepID=UPI0036CFD023